MSLDGVMWNIDPGDIGWKAILRPRANTTKASLDLDDFTQALVRRKLLGNYKYLSGIESGSEVFRVRDGWTPRAYSVDIG